MITKEQILQNVLEIREGATNFLTDTCTVINKIGETVEYGAAKPIVEEIETPCRFIIKSGDSKSNIASQERENKLKTYTGQLRLQLPIDIRVETDSEIKYIDGDKVIFYDVVFVPPRTNMTGAFVISIKQTS